jgi:amino acid transporter
MSAIAGEPESAEVEEFGYKPQFERTIKSFSSFAIGFSFISITSGIFTTFVFLLATSGPRGLWMWILAAVGQTLVALVYAHLAGRIPLSGSIYQWATRLSGPWIGWVFGWLAYAFLAVVVVATNYSFVTQAFMPLFGIAPSIATAQILTIAMAALEAGCIIFSTRFTSRLNSLAVVTEIAGVAGLTVVLLLAAAVSHKGSLANLTSTGVVHGGGNYYGINGPFMLAVLLGAFTIVGFEAAATLAEETQRPRQVVPKAMIRAVIASGVLGLLFLIALSVAMPNVREISGEATPITAIMQQQLGTVATKIFLVIFVVSLFANSLVIMLAGTRVVFSMARDGRFPGSKIFASVSTRFNTPIPAALLIFGGLVVIILAAAHSTTALTNLFGAATILPALIYLAVVVLFAAKRRLLPDEPEIFSLGRWRYSVVTLSILWLAFELEALVVPSQFWGSVKIVGVLLAIGAIVLAGLVAFSRRNFAQEPGGTLEEHLSAVSPLAEPSADRGLQG